MMTISQDHQQPTRQMDQTEAKSMRRISTWLFIMCILVFLMVVVGGATRLTDSGLSITEWKPVVGAVPPLSEAHWLSEFEKYKKIPESSEVNYGMDLQEFKFIYWWEWGHRFLGRLIGLAFFLPFLFFVITRQVKLTLGIKLFGLLILGGAQAFLGWYMVKSGLSDRVDVSQYRLAAHLGLAVLLFAMMAYLALELRQRAGGSQNKPVIALPKSLRWGAWGLGLAIYGQIILGAFVAGLRAGLTYNTWPLMDGRFIPAGYFSDQSGFLDLFETIEAVQFNHRIGAYILFIGAIWFFLAGRKSVLARQAHWLVIGVALQAVLGITTLLLHTPLVLGLAHQAGAMVVLLIAIWNVQSAEATHQRSTLSRSIDSSGSSSPAASST